MPTGNVLDRVICLSILCACVVDMLAGSRPRPWLIIGTTFAIVLTYG